MSWHYEPTIGIHTRNPTPNLPRPFTAADALNLDTTQLRRTTAVHEAGHAVMYLTHGIPFAHMEIGSIGPDNDGITAAGQVKSLPTFTATTRQMAMVLAAGECAQDRWLREQGLWTPERGWAVEVASRTDRHQIVDIDPGHDLDVLHHVTDRALDGLWDGVLRLGEALDRHGHLGYAQAAEAAGYAPLGR
jgi:hypothetical protein